MGTISVGTVLEDMQPDLSLISNIADNETLTGAGVDMLGYQGVVFFASALKGEIKTYGLKAQQDTDVAFGSAQDLAGSNVAFATGTSTDGFAFLEIHNPTDEKKTVNVKRSRHFDLATTDSLRVRVPAGKTATREVT